MDSVQEATDAVAGKNTTTSDATSKSWANTLSEELNGRSIAQKIFQDIYPLWWIVLSYAIFFVSHNSGCVIAMLLSMIWLFCIRFTARLVIWSTVLLLLLSLWAMSGFLIYNYVRTKLFQEAVIKTGFSLIDSSLYNSSILLGLCKIANCQLILSNHHPCYCHSLHNRFFVFCPECGYRDCSLG